MVVLHGVIGGGELGDVCATIGRKLVDINSTLSACGSLLIALCVCTLG